MAYADLKYLGPRNYCGGAWCKPHVFLWRLYWGKYSGELIQCNCGKELKNHRVICRRVYHLLNDKYASDDKNGFAADGLTLTMFGERSLEASHKGEISMKRLSQST